MRVLPRPPEEMLEGLAPAVVAYLEALEVLVVARETRIAALEARLRQDSSTTSRPPSSDPPKTQAQRRAPPRTKGDGEPRRRGGQPGHPGHHRELLGEERVDQVVEVTPEACRGC